MLRPISAHSRLGGSALRAGGAAPRSLPPGQLRPSAGRRRRSPAIRSRHRCAAAARPTTAQRGTARPPAQERPAPVRPGSALARGRRLGPRRLSRRPGPWRSGSTWPSAAGRRAPPTAAAWVPESGPVRAPASVRRSVPQWVRDAHGDRLTRDQVAQLVEVGVLLGAQARAVVDLRVHARSVQQCGGELLGAVDVPVALEAQHHARLGGGIREVVGVGHGAVGVRGPGGRRHCRRGGRGQLRPVVGRHDGRLDGDEQPGCGGDRRAVGACGQGHRQGRVADLAVDGQGACGEPTGCRAPCRATRCGSAPAREAGVPLERLVGEGVPLLCMVLQRPCRPGGGADVRTRMRARPRVTDESRMASD